MRSPRLAVASLVAVALAGAAVTTSPAQAARTIELVLDASGSMNAKLPSGETRLAAAKAAVAKLVPTLAADTVLGFRAYGHQSAREKRDCDDTQLLVPFGAAPGSGAAAVKAAHGLAARGYTPISRVLRLAAADLATAASGERMILLVSDGKETCDADPCATARALKAADATLVVHAIGFEVDSAARGELTCLATATGGSYFDASGVDGLVTALGRAAVKGMEKVASAPKAPGNLEIVGADLLGHDVIDATTGEKVGELSSFQRVLRVPAGIYNVRFGKALWRGVEVRADALTKLEPAVLAIEGAAMQGHRIVDSETGVEVSQLSSLGSQGPVLPGLYDVTFGGTVWRHVRLDGGRKTVLRPGIVAIEGATLGGHPVFDAEGREVARPSNLGSVVPLPPGTYSVDLGGRRVPFTLAEGQRLTLSAKASRP